MDIFNGDNMQIDAMSNTTVLWNIPRGHLVRTAKLRSLNFLSLFRDLHKPTRFGGGGGGGSSRIFPG